MSTRISIATGLNFHLYQEGFDKVPDMYLKLSGTDYSASNDGVFLRIPVALWEFIRKIPAVSFNLLDKTDEEIRAKVEEEVEANFKELAKVRAEAAEMEPEKAERFLAWATYSALRYGSEDEDREVHVKRGIGRYMKQKASLREIKKSMSYFEQYREPVQEDGGFESFFSVHDE